MNPLVSKILERHDRGENVETIRTAEDVSFGYIYGVLREHRSERPRQPRTRTSKKRKLILGLLAGGIAAPRVAFLAKCTPAYVYKLIQEEEPAP
jgi:hypothetical protein